MPRSASVISVFLASPSDVASEREIVETAVQQWNHINGFGRSIIFEILRWEKSIPAGFGKDGQDVVNNNIPDYDILISIFWTRLGSRTPRFESGSVEEYERALERRNSGQDVEIAFFFKDVPVNPLEVDLQQLTSLQKFERRIQSDGAFSKRFNDIDALRFEVSLLLDRTARHFSEDFGQRYGGVGNQFTIHPADPTPAEYVDVDERGLFDISASLQQHATEATLTLHEIVERMSQMTGVIDEVNAEFGEITKFRPIEEQESKNIVEKVSRSMVIFSAFLEENAPKFKENSILMANDARDLINVSYDFTLHNPDAVEFLTAFQDSLLAMVAGMDGAVQGYTGMRDTIKSVPRATTEFNKARRGLVNNIEFMINSVESARLIVVQAITEMSDLITWVRINKNNGPAQS